MLFYRLPKIVCFINKIPKNYCTKTYENVEKRMFVRDFNEKSTMNNCGAVLSIGWDTHTRTKAVIAATTSLACKQCREPH